jgi:hypothetical protein
VRGAILRIADLRSQSAYIRVAVRRTTFSRRMVEFSFVHRRTEMGPRRSSRHPEVKVVHLAALRVLHLDLGARRLLSLCYVPNPWFDAS